jgi:hypothetical protein
VSSLRTDTRGVTVQIGAVLLLGILILLMTFNQAAIVPSQNHDIEFSHNERVQSDLRDARNAIVRAGTGGNTQPGSVELGTSFPSRLATVNPPPASGSFGPSSVSGNATITGAEPLNRDARSYWADKEMAYETVGFRYEPSYREYANAPATVYENTVLYNEFPGGPNRTLTEQSIIDGRTISLVSLQDVPTQSSSGTTSLDFRAISPSSTQIRTIAVRNASATEPVNVTLPTQLSNETWTELVDGEQNVLTVDRGPQNVTISLRPQDDAGNTITYNLRIAAVTADRTTEKPETAYVTVVDGANRSVAENTTNTLVAEVRDQYNNPVSGVEVNATFNESVQSLSNTLETTTGAGHARFMFKATGNGSAVVSLDGSNQQAETALSAFSKDSSAFELQSESTVVRISRSSGRVRIPYSASGTGSFVANLSSPATPKSTAPLSVYSLAGSTGGTDGPDWIDPVTGEETTTNHSTVNNEDFSDKILYIPPGTDFVPEDDPNGDDQGDNIDYTFYSYEIEGNVKTDERLSMTATDGAINFGSSSSVISGKQLTLTADGPNGSIDIDGATLDTTPGNVGQGNGRIEMTTTGDISAVGTNMTANKSISITADGSIDLQDSNLQVVGDGDITITAGGSIDLRNSNLEIKGKGDIILVATDNIILNNAVLNIEGGNTNNAGASAEANTIYTNGASFQNNANPLDTTGTVNNTETNP